MVSTRGTCKLRTISEHLFQTHDYWSCLLYWSLQMRGACNWLRRVCPNNNAHLVHRKQSFEVMAASLHMEESTSIPSRRRPDTIPVLSISCTSDLQRTKYQSNILHATSLLTNLPTVQGMQHTFKLHKHREPGTHLQTRYQRTSILVGPAVYTSWYYFGRTQPPDIRFHHVKLYTSPTHFHFHQSRPYLTFLLISSNPAHREVLPINRLLRTFFLYPARYTQPGMHPTKQRSRQVKKSCTPHYRQRWSNRCEDIHCKVYSVCKRNGIVTPEMTEVLAVHSDGRIMRWQLWTLIARLACWKRG
jgi:hypothetical protein